MFPIYFILFFLLACGEKSGHLQVKGHPSILKLAASGPYKTLDPALAHDTLSMRHIARIYEPLFEFQELANGDQILRPLLLEAMPQMIIDEKGEQTYFFSLKKNIFFHNAPCFPQGVGRQLVANDMKFSLQRILNPENHSVVAPLIQNIIKDIKVIDDLHFEITLLRPTTHFLNILSLPNFSLMAKECTNPNFIPVGSGPFYLDKEFHHFKYLYKKNSRYHQQHLPKIEGISIEIMNDWQNSLLQLFKGNIQILSTRPDNFNEVFQDKRFQAEFAKGTIKYHSAPTLGTFAILFNYTLPLFSNKLVREALILALDKKKLAQILNFHLLDSDLPESSNMTQAKKIMDLVRKEDPTCCKNSLILYLYPSAAGKNLGEYLRKTWKELGLNLQVEMPPWPITLQKVFQRDFGLLGDWHASTMFDPIEFLMLFYSGSQTPGMNRSNYSNKNFDQKFEQIVKETNLEIRSKKIHELEELLNQDKAAIFIHHGSTSTLYSPQLKNVSSKGEFTLGFEKHLEFY